MTAYYAVIKTNGSYNRTLTVKPGQSATRRAILDRCGLSLKGHTVELSTVDGKCFTAK